MKSLKSESFSIPNNLDVWSWCIAKIGSIDWSQWIGSIELSSISERSLGCDGQTDYVSLTV